MPAEKRCPECGAPVRDTTFRIRRRLDGHAFEADVSAKRCGRGHVDVPIRQWLAFDIALVRALTAAGPVGGDALRFLRESAGLSGQALAELLDVRRETVSRWEHGRAPVDRGAWVTVGALAVEKMEGGAETLGRLQALGKRPRKRVRLNVAA